jgi:hypothetical protein
LDHLTRRQLAKLLDMERSRSYLRETLNRLAAAGLVLCLAGSGVTMPHIYTPTRKGREYADRLLGTPIDKRFRPSEERDKARNEFFLKHTLAGTDVLIAARLLAQTTPAIRLTRMYTERALRRKIYVALPESRQTVCIEPDAGLDFLLTETWHEKPETWQDFIYLEIYRNLPPQEWRFKQKVAGYVSIATSGQQETLFQTPAMSIAVFAATDTMAQTLKQWTEEALQEMGRPTEGEWFFFCSLDSTTTSPEEMFLSPVWEQAFGTDKTPLLVLE